MLEITEAKNANFFEKKRKSATTRNRHGAGTPGAKGILLLVMSRADIQQQLMGFRLELLRVGPVR
jgi:hypothetical protein